MPKSKSPLSQIHLHHLTDVFADIKNVDHNWFINYEWFINSGMTWGDADYTIYRVERLRDVIKQYDNKQDDNKQDPLMLLLARKMLDVLEPYDDDDLISMSRRGCYRSNF